MSGIFKKYNESTGQWEAILVGTQGPQGATLDVVNNTNNYLLTATGGSTVNGESGLTWDGTQLEITGSIIPAADNIYDLGSQGRTWRDVYVGPGSLYVDGTKVLSSQAAELVITTDAGQSLKILETGADDITLQTETGNIELKGTVEIESGKKITDSAATQVVIGDSLKVEGNIIPDLNEARDLGSSSLRWRDLYLSGNTLHLGDTKFTRTDTGDVEVKDSNGNRKKVIADAIELRRGGKVVKIDIDETSGQLITTANDSTESQVNVPSLEARDSVIQADVDSLETRLVADISTETGRIDAILTGASADTDTFVEVVSLINGVDTANDQAFASYVLRTDASVDSLEGQVTQVGTSGNETTGTVTLAGSGATTVSQTGNTVTINTPTVAGPQGPQGVNGTIGVDGAQGPTGPQGNNGSNGSTGAQGPTGPTGGTGSTGAQGVQGPAGTSGSGTANYLTKWNGTTSQTNSLIYDNGTNVGIGTNSPANKLQVVTTTTEPIAYFGQSQTSSASNGLIKLQSGRIPQSGSDTSGESGIIFAHSGGTYGVNFDGAGGYIKSIRSSVYSTTTYADSDLVFATSKDNADTERMRITSGGNVGIGTTTDAGYKLDVNGTGRFSGELRVNNTITAEQSTAETASIVATSGWSSTANNPIITFGRLGLAVAGQIGYDDTNTRLYIGTTTNHNLSIRTADSDRLTIDNSGNVGIGTTGPRQKLNVNGHIETMSGYGLKASYNNTDAYHGSLSWATLQLGNNGDNRIIGGRTATGGNLKFYVNNTNDATQYSTTPDGTLAMTIASDGNVGIGTPSPAVALHIKSSSPAASLQASASKTSGSRADFNAYNSDVSTVGYIRFGAVTDNVGTDMQFAVRPAAGSLTEAMRITSSGNVGIGTTSDAGYKLDVNGTGRYSGRLSIITSNPTLLIAETSSKTTGLRGDLSFDNSALSTVASIRATAVTDNVGTNLEFHTRPASGSLTKVFDLSSSGAATFSNNLTLSSSSGNLDVGGIATIRGNGSAFATHSLTTGAANVAIYDQRNASGTLINRINAGGISYINGGDVGIGTPSPDGKLDVNGLSYFRDDIILYSTKKLYLDSGSDTYLTEVSANTMQFVTGGSERMRITSSGNVGIGTTSPSSKLHVKTGSTGGILILEGSAGRYITTGVDGGGQYIEQVGTSASERTLRIQSSNGSGAYTQLFLDGHNQRIFTSSNVNVGIGTTNPLSKLHVASGSISIDADQAIRKAGDNYIIGYSSTLPGITMGSGTATDMVAINAGGQERFRITTTGNVGIGTTSPSATLHLSSAAPYIYLDDISTSGTRNRFEILNGDVGTTQTATFSFNNTSGTNLQQVISFNENGNVGIGTTSPTSKLQVNGTILPGENGTQNLGSNTLRWNTVYTSDLSLKNDVGDWTIVEGEDDLFLYNNKRDKVYKFNLTEVDKETAPKKRS